MSQDLKQKAAKGIVWKFIENGGTQGVQFISGIYIARILSPDDYGLIGMMAIFLGISQVFIDSGFRATLIQRGRNITHDHFNVVFMFNLFVSCFFYLFIFLGAPYIAKFYNEPELVQIARVLGLNLIFVSLGIIHQTILEKNLKFRTLSKINLVAVIISVVAGIVLAKMGLGYWALIIMTLLQSATFSITIWFINNWTPSLGFNIQVFKQLFKKSMQVFTAGIIGTIGNNIYLVLIGKNFTTNDVGFFSQGQKLQNRVGNLITTSMQTVLYPVQSLMQDDIPRLKNAVRKNVVYTTFISLPAIIGFVAIAKPFVLISLTEKWLPSVYYLQILSIATVFSTIKVPINSYIRALGRFEIGLRFSILRNSICILLVFIGVALNVKLKLLVLGLPLTEFIGLSWVFYYAKRIINYNVGEIFSDVLPALLTATLMGVLIIIMESFLELNFFTLLLQVVSGCIAYVVLNYICNRKVIIEIKELVKNTWHSGKRRAPINNYINEQ